MFDPIAEGQKTARENAKADRQATEQEGEAVEQNLSEAQKLAKTNAKLDDKARGEAEMVPQDVGTAERDIPEGKPVTSDPDATGGSEEEDEDETPEVSTDLKLKELQEIAEKEGVEGEFTKPGTSKQTVVDAILAHRAKSSENDQ